MDKILNRLSYIVLISGAVIAAVYLLIFAGVKSELLQYFVGYSVIYLYFIVPVAHILALLGLIYYFTASDEVVWSKIYILNYGLFLIGGWVFSSLPFSDVSKYGSVLLQGACGIVLGLLLGLTGLAKEKIANSVVFAVLLAGVYYFKFVVLFGLLILVLYCYFKVVNTEGKPRFIFSR